MFVFFNSAQLSCLLLVSSYGQGYSSELLSQYMDLIEVQLIKDR